VSHNLGSGVCGGKFPCIFQLCDITGFESDQVTDGHSGDKDQKENLEIETCGISLDKVVYFCLTSPVYVPCALSVG
jgi:hypothetical protein